MTEFELGAQRANADKTTFPTMVMIIWVSVENVIL